MEVSMLEKGANETVRENPLASLPKISYRKALSSRFTLNQVIYTVRDCPGNIFKRFVNECGWASLPGKNWKLINQEQILRLLEQENYSDVARWYSLNALLEHQVRVPFATDL